MRQVLPFDWLTTDQLVSGGIYITSAYTFFRSIENFSASQTSPAWLYSSAASPSERLRSDGSLAITRLAFRRVEKKIGSCSISFLVHPARSPGMMLLCLSASRIYNTFSISTRSREKIRQLFYILSGSSRQKSWHDVIMPERF